MNKDIAIWVKKDCNNNSYLSLKVGDENYNLFKNHYKREEKHPDYVLPRERPKAPETPDNSDTTNAPAHTPESHTEPNRATQDEINKELSEASEEEMFRQ